MLNGWAYLLHWGPMDPLGLIIYWLPVLIWELVVLPSIKTGEANLVDPMSVLPSCEVVLYVRFRLRSAGVWKTRTSMCAVSVMISFERIVSQACKISPLLAASSTIVWPIEGIATGIIYGMSRLINNLCGEFLLVVSVSVTFLIFTSLVWVATFGSLFGSISVLSSSEL